ncbi:alkene reductase [Flavobacterium granuli]|uniref:N-ethylmaleimide reductase n=1 Tax=Flavobacterium granuli TaxID=280093 RepID=A0A1M5NLP3_9FLAO|nr:alkene reductase [Flavobacterium granuli]PRZ23328.1 N-ethylmaleimide reductase [Flavobacterium granuli]SHG90470.1 N-ethylmaleimide reductase [Flavobacterium granuli]
MKTYKLFTPEKVGSLPLKNRIVMAPMTRCRAIDNVPNELMAAYYTQRSSEGLIITEGTSPSPNGLGYARIPGIFSELQVKAWKKVTEAVHKNGGKIFVQLMHSGRISHPLNMHENAHILAPSAVKAAGQIWTDQKGLQDFVVPKEMSPQEILHARTEYVAASENALFAGFDGVELHAANGYLLEEFLSPVSNTRTDTYGGTIENRCRFVIEVAAAVANAIGKEKTAIRLSPYGVASDMPHYPEIEATYDYLSKELNKLDIAYIHLVDHSAMGAPPVPLEIKKTIRNNFKNTLILCGGYNKESAEAELESGLADLIAFGRPFINNPDLVERFKNNLALSQDLNMDLFYTADEKGYTDYPVYKK